MSEKHTYMDQRRAPIHEALENFRRKRVVPFDVLGHKRGRGNRGTSESGSGTGQQSDLLRNLQ